MFIKRNKLSKVSLLMTLVLVLSLISNTAIAEQSTKLAFSDVPTSHWGVKDIVKLNLRKVVAGYSNGRFYPAKPVTQIEAVLLAVRNLEAEAQMDSIDLSQPIPVVVPEWVKVNYKKEMLYAIQKGLIVPSENNFLATADATRAWVAQLMVRMINKNAEATQLAEQNPTWADAGTIPAWALGAVNVVAKYKLVNGYQDNTFKPNSHITRAEITTLLSRSEQYLGLSGTTLNTRITSLSGSSLTLLVNGVVKSVSLTGDTYIFDAQGKITAATSLKANETVKVILAGNLVKYIEILPADTVLSKLKGTVIEVLVQDKILVIRDELQKLHTISWAATVATDALAQILVDSQVELGLNSSGEAVTVQNLSTEVTASNTGIINSLKPDQLMLIIKNSNGKVIAYQYTSELIVKINGQRFPVITDLQVGDEVKFKESAGVITELELLQANQQLKLSGKVVLFSAEKRLLTIQKEDASLVAFLLADDVDIKMSGLTYPQLSNVAIDDLVELTIEQGQVTILTVKDRSAELVVIGTVSAVDTTNRILTIKTEKDELKTYEVTSSAEFSLNDQITSNLYNVKKDMKIELQLVNNKVTYLETKNTVEGSLVTLDQNRHTLVLKATNSDERSYTMSTNVDVDIEGASSPTLSSLNKNDYLEVRLEDNQITKINVQKVFSYQITEVLKGLNELKVKDKDGSSKYLALKRAKLLIPEISYPVIDDFVVGTTVKATFFGNKLTKVEVLPAIHGQISSINTLTNTIVVKAFDGVIRSYTFNSKSEIVNGDNKSTLLSTLAAGNRVEIEEKTDGGFTVTVMKKITGKYQAQDQDGKKIHLLQAPSSWYSYSVANNAYVHSGSQLLTVDNLLKDNQIDVYYLEDIAYEIEKK